MTPSSGCYDILTALLNRMWFERGPTEILDREVEECFQEKPGVVLTFPVMLLQREKSLLLGTSSCANKGKCFECLLL